MVAVHQHEINFLSKRLHLQEEQDLNFVKPYAAVAPAASATTASGTASDDGTMKDAFSKLTKDKFIPDSTKVISSLFGKLSNVIATHQTDEDQEEEVEAAALHDRGLHKGQKISINAFYEDVYNSHNIGLLHSSLDSYASTVNGGPLDKATLALISRHYRNFYEEICSAENSIDWVVLRDILAIILDEDTALGMSLMLTEMEHHSDFMADFINTRKRPQIGLYAAALYCASQSFTKAATQRRKVVVDFPPGFLYCSVKTLSDSNLLKGKSEQVLQKALSRVKCDDE